MPLKTGRTNKVVGENISEMMGSFKKTGKLGTSKPKNAKKAQSQATAIALGKARSGPFYVKRKDANRLTKIT
jgi:hypothetical protein